MTRHCPNPSCPGLARDGVAPEFVDGVGVCLDCGGSLMAGMAPDDPPEPPDYNDFRTVFIAADVVQAHLLRGLIEAEGIIVYLKGESLRSAIGELPVDVTRLEVQVPVEDRERGRAIAMRFEGPSPKARD
jgi:hypothetical protein